MAQAGKGRTAGSATTSLSCPKMTKKLQRSTRQDSQKYFSFEMPLCPGQLHLYDMIMMQDPSSWYYGSGGKLNSGASASSSHMACA